MAKAEEGKKGGGADESGHPAFTAAALLCLRYLCDATVSTVARGMGVSTSGTLEQLALGTQLGAAAVAMLQRHPRNMLIQRRASHLLLSLLKLCPPAPVAGEGVAAVASHAESNTAIGAAAPTENPDPYDTDARRRGKAAKAMARARQGIAKLLLTPSEDGGSGAGATGDVIRALLGADASLRAAMRRRVHDATPAEKAARRRASVLAHRKEQKARVAPSCAPHGFDTTTERTTASRALARLVVAAPETITIARTLSNVELHGGLRLDATGTATHLIAAVLGSADETASMVAASASARLESRNNGGSGGSESGVSSPTTVERQLVGLLLRNGACDVLAGALITAKQEELAVSSGLFTKAHVMTELYACRSLSGIAACAHEHATSISAIVIGPLCVAHKVSKRAALWLCATFELHALLRTAVVAAAAGAAAANRTLAHHVCSPPFAACT